MPRRRLQKPDEPSTASNPSGGSGQAQKASRVRIDKWLWAARLFKSRSLASQACLAGQVKIGGQRVKPSREVHVGEIITALTGRIQRTVKVLGWLERRVGAAVASQAMEDLTPPEEYLRAREEAAHNPVPYHKGFGRPTKKQRRQMKDFLDP
jgi:ribosome-associated heat shock protein Hsp15